MKTLEDVKDKWRNRFNVFLIESAYMIEKFDAEKADAALECLFEERGGCHKRNPDDDEAGPILFDAKKSILGNVIEIAEKKDKGKPRYDLIPGDALHEVVKVLSNGAEKYADRNWEIGQPWGKVFGAMMRHCWAWWRGEELDKESGLHHMAHAGVEALFLLAYALRKVGIDDRSLKQIINPPVEQTGVKAQARDIFLKGTYQKRCYGRDVKHDKNFLVTPCPNTESVMIGSIYCKEKCNYFLGVDKENDIVKCTYKDGGLKLRSSVVCTLERGYRGGFCTSIINLDPVNNNEGWKRCRYDLCQVGNKDELFKEAS